jgi:hypothetical protein
MNAISKGNAHDINGKTLWKIQLNLKKISRQVENFNGM